MVGFAQGSRSALSYVPEVTYGVTPATPTFVQIPYTTHTLDLEKARVQGNDIQADRMVRTDRQGNRTVKGDIVADLRKADFDPLLEASFFDSFSTNVLKIGTTLKSFSIEDGALDIGQYRLFTGVTVNTAAFSIKPNQMVTATFGLIGDDMSVATSTSATTLTASSTNAAFDSYSGVVDFADAGGTLASVATVTGIDFTITNNVAPTFVVGSDTTPYLEYGLATVEGTLTAYFEDATLINRFLNETETAFEVSVDDPTGTNPYTFLFPRVKINGANIPVSNPSARVITMPFVAIYDTTEGTSLKLTRTV